MLFHNLSASASAPLGRCCSGAAWAPLAPRSRAAQAAMVRPSRGAPEPDRAPLGARRIAARVLAGRLFTGAQEVS